MKINKPFLTVITIGIILTVMAFSNSDEKSEGAIGDVKYSVLPPDKFREKNGKGWVLMDDKIPLNGSDLADEGVLELPDARGMFIRGLNLTRSDDKADPFSKENSEKRQRNMGDYQSDAYMLHDHDLRTRDTKSHIFITHGWAGGWGGDGRMHAVNGAINSTSHEEDILKSTPMGGNETRPKNIALYIYIKINE